jgi:hypothetical protein
LLDFSRRDFLPFHFGLARRRYGSTPGELTVRLGCGKPLAAPHLVLVHRRDVLRVLSSALSVQLD